MTVEEIFAPSSSGKSYSIQDVLSAVGSQYQPAKFSAISPTQSVDDILSGLSNQIPASAMPMKVGASRFINSNGVDTGIGASKYIDDLTQQISNPYQPATFDKLALQFDYANRLVERGYSPQRAIEEAGLGQIAGSAIGAYYGKQFGGPIGGFIGSTVGGAIGGVVDDFLDW